MLFQKKNNKRKTNPFQGAHQNPLFQQQISEGLEIIENTDTQIGRQTEFILQRLSIDQSTDDTDAGIKIQGLECSYHNHIKEIDNIIVKNKKGNKPQKGK